MAKKYSDAELAQIQAKAQPFIDQWYAEHPEKSDSWLSNPRKLYDYLKAQGVLPDGAYVHGRHVANETGMPTAVKIAAIGTGVLAGGAALAPLLFGGGAAAGGAASAAGGAGAGGAGAAGTIAPLASIPSAAVGLPAVGGVGGAVGAGTGVGAGAAGVGAGIKPIVDAVKPSALEYGTNIGLNTLGTIVGARAAGKAADQQQQAAQDALDFQKLRYEEQKGLLAPYGATGQAANSTLSQLMGLPTAAPQGQPAAQNGPSGGMVTLRAPDGTTRPVPQDQVAHYTAQGAQVVR